MNLYFFITLYMSVLLDQCFSIFLISRPLYKLKNSGDLHLDIKTEKRNRLQFENDLIIYVSKIAPRFGKLLKNKQVHSSH